MILKSCGLQQDIKGWNSPSIHQMLIEQLGKSMIGLS
jgi:hypothetical protein